MKVLAEPVRLGNATAANRLVFGPHETNLGRGRRLSERHVAYYRARALGGAGVVVVEEASVDSSDWPYERAPLAAECADGWEAVADACHSYGSLVVAALGHSGGQGSSAYGQRALWGPSNVPDVATREVPKAMDTEDTAVLVDGFRQAAQLALAAGCDGVEVNAGQWSLLRQFCSGLTNQRQDAFGSDRALVLRQVLEAVRGASGQAVVGLRFSCDELAPWAGLVPEAAATMLAGLVAEQGFDYVTVVRGSAYGTGATRPDGHVHEAFNREATALVRGALPASVAVIAQGSVVAPTVAAALVSDGVADLVEMTRAFVADAELGLKVAGGHIHRVRPCTLCNQACQVRDVRNPLVSCMAEPQSGYETVEPRAPDWRTERPPIAFLGSSPGGPARLLVVGGGPAGLECARVASLRGIPATVLERGEVFGGMLRVASRLPGRSRLALLADWLEQECRLAGVELVAEHETALEELDAHPGPVALCTGGRAGRRSYGVEPFASVLTAAEVLAADPHAGTAPPSPAVVYDPIGGPIGVGTAEHLASLGSSVVLVTPEFVAGEQLARTGDLAPASVRLQQAGVEVLRRSLLRSVAPGAVTIEARDSGELRTVDATVLVDAGHRLPEDALLKAVAGRGSVFAAGDAVAPRTVLEAVLEGRRVAMGLPLRRRESLPA
ncbi:MAG: mycofactocin system FadH/OYE family oxidoreductase 1 [Acidimicrobiales bacterium]